MLTDHEILELIPAYALDALDEREAARVRAHLPNCARCRHALEDYRRVNEDLAQAVPQAPLPPALKARTLGRLEGRAALHAPEPKAAILSQRRNWSMVAAGLAAALALVALVVTLLLNNQLAREFAVQRDLTVVMAYADGAARTIHGTTVAPLAVGKLYADADSNVAALITVNMPPLEANETFAVTLVQSDGQKTSAGNFGIDAQGTGWVLLRAPRPLVDYQSVTVTRMRGGGPAPDGGQIILEANLETLP